MSARRHIKFYLKVLRTDRFTLGKVGFAAALQKANGRLPDGGKGKTRTLKVEGCGTRQPTVHRIQVEKMFGWLKSSGRNPAEESKK